jgi:hypothetical protein
LKTEFAPRFEKPNPEFAKAMNRLFRKYKAMSFEEKVRYIENRRVVMRQWVEPKEYQGGLF